jgi:hypothetical protein
VSLQYISWKKGTLQYNGRPELGGNYSILARGRVAVQYNYRKKGRLQYNSWSKG